MDYCGAQGHRQVSRPAYRECLAETDRFIELYLDCVANRDNIGLLFNIVSKIKTVKDADKKVVDNSVNQYRDQRWSRLTVSLEPLRSQRARPNHHPKSRRASSLGCHNVPWQDKITARYLP